MGGLFAGSSILPPLEFLLISGLLIAGLIFASKKLGKRFSNKTNVVDQVYFQGGVVAILKIGDREVLVTTKDLRANFLPKSFSSVITDERHTEKEKPDNVDADATVLAETKKCLEDILSER